MNDLAEHLEGLQSSACSAVREATERAGLRSATDDELVAALTLAASVQRLIDAIVIEAVSEVQARSATAFVDERMTTRFGCHDVSELVQRTTLLSPQSVGRLQRAATAVRVDTSISSGDALEPEMPQLRQALLDGVVGVDGVLAISGPLHPAHRRVEREAMLVADSVLAAEARGEGPDGAPPACAELLRIQAQAWSIALDQDGAEPRERMTIHRREVRLGTPIPAGVPIRGILMPEVAAQLQRIFDATLSPRVADVRFLDSEEQQEADDVPLDLRTRGQKQHDALANALSVAASSGLLPTVGGAAPTLIVSVTADDVVSGSGYAHVEGCDVPLSVAAALHTGCAGAVQRVTLGAGGRIERIGTEERVFNRHQRRAISLRDGNCVIPGCSVPAGWCEIHHVTEHAAGGPTHTDNGVLLCWHHHRFLERSGWRIRMNHGVPEVQAPAWADASLRWRAVTTSKTRLRDAVLRR